MHKSFTPLAVFVTLFGLVACGGSSIHKNEDFSEETPFWQKYDLPPEQVCDAANLALLSQGYKVSAKNNRELLGQKEFQPEKERHALLEFQIICHNAPQTTAKTMLFASATESHYVLKESNTSAGLSIPKIGSISLPFSGSADSLVKINSTTIEDANFYHRFHDLVRRFLGSPTAK